MIVILLSSTIKLYLLSFSKFFSSPLIITLDGLGSKCSYNIECFPFDFIVISTDEYEDNVLKPWVSF